MNVPVTLTEEQIRLLLGLLPARPGTSTLVDLHGILCDAYSQALDPISEHRALIHALVDTNPECLDDCCHWCSVYPVHSPPIRPTTTSRLVLPDWPKPTAQTRYVLTHTADCPWWAARTFLGLDPPDTGTTIHTVASDETDIAPTTSHDA